MSGPRAAPHLAQLLHRFGIREAPAGAAVGLIAFLQYVFLAKLWQGYPLRWSGDAIHQNVVWTGVALSLAGAAAIVVLSLRRWSAGTAAARRLEQPATSSSFDALRRSLMELAGRSTLPQPPALLYTPKNGLALEVRQDGPGAGAIVVGLDQRRRQKADPEAMAAELGHEISHLELGTTRAEIMARRAVVLHFRLLAWLVAVFTAMLGFIDPTGIGSTPDYGGFVPVFASSIYIGLTAQFVVLALSAAIVFVYSYFAVVRREHIHDLRGSQLAGSAVLAERVFAPAARQQGVRHAIGDFFRLHPSAAARTRVIRRRDYLLLSAILFPLIVAGVQPMLPLLTAGWRDVLGVGGHWWNLGLTVAGGFLLYLVLSADAVRLGLGGVLGKRTWLRIPLYGVCAGLATQVPRIALEVTYGWRHDRPAEVVIERILTGFEAGGTRIALMVALVLLILSYLSAVRIAALGEAGARRAAWLDRVIGALIVTGGVAAASLRSSRFMTDTLISIMVLSVLYAVRFIVISRCSTCGRIPLESLRLRTRCRCQAERLPALKRFAGNAATR